MKIFTPIRILMRKFGWDVNRLVDKNDLSHFLGQFRPLTTDLDLVRVGGTGDGAYLLPNDFDGIKACVSPGCDGLWTFESEIWEKYKIPSHMMDEAAKRPEDLSEGQFFYEGWLGAADTESEVSLDTWISKEQVLQEGDLLLQMDIEGAEYLSLLSTSSANLRRFRMMVIEFHYSVHYRNYHAFEILYKPLMKRLLTDFYVVHFHANNCCGTWEYGDISFPQVFEVTFRRKDRVKMVSGFAKTPHDLDVKNVPSNDAVVLDWSWMKAN